MNALHSRLRTAVEEKLAETRKLLRYAQDTILTLADPKWLGRAVPGWHEWPEIEGVLTLSMRQHEAALRVLKRHRLTTLGDAARGVGLEDFADQPWCLGCRSDRVPCPDIRDLADAYGVPVDTEEGGDA